MSEQTIMIMDYRLYTYKERARLRFENRKKNAKKVFKNFILLNDSSYTYNHAIGSDWETCMIDEMRDNDSYSYFKEVLSIIYDPDQFKSVGIGEYKSFNDFAMDVAKMLFLKLDYTK